MKIFYDEYTLKDPLKILHMIWWALWMDFGQPKWMLPILEWVNKKREKFL
jgi:hypothetical protein